MDGMKIKTFSEQSWMDVILKKKKKSMWMVYQKIRPEATWENDMILKIKNKNKNYKWQSHNIVPSLFF
jgi:hypothetical protein